MTIWLGTSWKMTKTLGEAREFAERVAAQATPGRWRGVQPFIIPPATALSTVRAALPAEHGVLLGAQNAHWEDAGAWTGEVSVPQVADAGAQLVEIGHAERRQHFNETVETTRLKVQATLRHGLTPLLCIGEPAEVREAGDSVRFILDQAAGALDGLSSAELAQVLIAYEPIWAIGEKGRPATPEELAEPFGALAQTYGTRVRAILYGGSVSQDNAAQTLAVDGVEGLFVGRSAWRVEGFLELLAIATAHAGSRASAATTG